jgi:hypothetical protein
MNKEVSPVRECTSVSIPPGRDPETSKGRNLLSVIGDLRFAIFGKELTLPSTCVISGVVTVQEWAQVLQAPWKPEFS